MFGGRGFEIRKLERQNILLNRNVPGDEEHMRIHLEKRKGWTAKASNGENDDGLRGERPTTHPLSDPLPIFGLIGHYYNVYSNPPEGIALDCFKHVSDWLMFADARLYGRARSPAPSDLVFLNFHLTSGKVHWGKEMSSEAITSIFKDFMYASGVLKPPSVGNPERFPYTTHCLRRGGAQYRFMLAPVAERWTLSQIKWWGGWTEGERVSHLLVGALHSDHT